MDEVKTCNKCNETKPLTEFYLRSDTGKYRPDCKKCRNTYTNERRAERREYSKSYYQKNKDRLKKNYREWYDKTYHSDYQVRKRRSYNYAKYGITSEDYMDMWNKTDGKCYICGQEETVERNGKVKRLAIDHCHDSGEVRGLLCQNCNRGIGLLKDNVETLEKAIKYLKDHYGK